MDVMDQDTLSTFGGMALRHGATVAAGILVTDGYLSGNQSEMFVSAVMLFGGVALSWWNKVGAKKVAAELAALKQSQATPAATPATAVKS
jgi:hypothetical protein